MSFSPDSSDSSPSSSLSADDKRTLKGLLAAVLTMQILTPFLQSGVAVLLPAMGRTFSCSATELGLVSTVYCMALAIFNLAMGRAGDKWGRRKVCMASMVILTPTVALMGFVPNIESVIGLRFFQGMGTAAFSTSSLAMMVACSPPSMRGRLLGITSTGVYVGLSIGPLIGGYVNALWGWEVFFWGISLWAMFCFVVMLLLVRKEWYESPELPYDWIGFVLFAAGMIVLVQGCAGPMPDQYRPIVLLAGLALSAVFLVWEYRLGKTIPLLDIRVLIHNRLFVLSNLASFSLYASLFSLTFFYSLYLQYVRGMDSDLAGTVIFLQPVVQVFFTLPGGWLSDRIGPSPVALAGNVFAVASLALALFLDATSPMWHVSLILILNGLGMALFVTPNTVMIMTSVDPAHMSQASGLVGTGRTAGMLLSMLIATFCLRLTMGDASPGLENSAGLISAMHLSFLVFCILCTVSFLCSILRMGRFVPRG